MDEWMLWCELSERFDLKKLSLLWKCDVMVYKYDKVYQQSFWVDAQILDAQM